MNKHQGLIIRFIDSFIYRFLLTNYLLLGKREFQCPADNCDKAYFGREKLADHTQKVHGKSLKLLLAVSDALSAHAQASSNDPADLHESD